MRKTLMTILIVLFIFSAASAGYKPRDGQLRRMTDIVSAADDTTAAVGLKHYLGSHGQYTKIDWYFRIYAKYPSHGNDDIVGYIVMQLKNNSLPIDTTSYVERHYLDSDSMWTDSLVTDTIAPVHYNANCGTNWYIYDSSNALNTTDSIQEYCGTSPFTPLSFPLPPADSVRFIMRSGATQDTIDYWFVDYRLSGDSDDPSDAIYGEYFKSDITPAADDTTPNWWINTYLNNNQTYKNLCFWFFTCTETTAARDDIDGDLFFEMKRDTVYKGAWQGNTVLTAPTVAFNTTDSLCIVRHYAINGLPNEYRLRIATDATADSLFLTHYKWMLTK